MWFKFASAIVVLAVVAALGGCGARRLDLVVTLDDTSCATRVPAGGSILYEISVGELDAPDG
jgi:hypothetical protein